MKVTIISRRDSQKLLSENCFPENTAVISFHDPLSSCKKGYARLDYGSEIKVEYCEAEDLDLDYLPEKGLTYETYFPDAEKTARFIYEAYSSGMDIICQCDYGQSRSAGCAAAIQEHFYRNGISIFADYRYYPNQVIYHKIYDALENVKKSLGGSDDKKR